MSILELNFENGWRGGERQTLYNMQGFRSKNIQTELACQKGSPMEIESKKNGFTVHSFNSIFGVIWFLIVSGKRYDFIHAQTSQILTYCVFTKLFHQRKVIFTRRVNFVQRSFFTKLKYHFTDKIFAISDPVKKTLEKLTKRMDIEVISDIVLKKEVDTKRANAFFKQFKVGEKVIIATIASLTFEKDPFTTLKAIRSLRKKRNDFVFFHFGSGKLQEQVEKKIIEFDLKDIYILPGFQPDVEDFFSMFKVFILTSTEEGLGSSVLDAFINRVPVVATDVGGLKDLLSDERGILCEMKNSTAIAQGIETFLSNEEKVKACCERAYHYVNQFHNMETISDRYISWMESQIQK